MHGTEGGRGPPFVYAPLLPSLPPSLYSPIHPPSQPHAPPPVWCMPGCPRCWLCRVGAAPLINAYLHTNTHTIHAMLHTSHPQTAMH